MIFYPPCRLNAYSLANIKYKYRSFHFKNYEILEILEILESYKKLQLNTNLMICEACCLFMKSVWSRSPFHPTFLHSYIYKLSTLRIIQVFEFGFRQKASSTGSFSGIANALGTSIGMFREFSVYVLYTVQCTVHISTLPQLFINIILTLFYN